MERGTHMNEKSFPNLSKPLKIRGTIIKNRVMSAPNMLFHTVDGRADDYYTGYLEHKARGGAGIVNLGEVSVGDGGNHTPEMLKTLDNLPMFAELAAAIHEHGALASAEITHGGAKGKPQFNRERMPKGPSPCKSQYDGSEVPALTEEDILFIISQYADTAAYMFSAGFDIAHLHFGHGWLPAQFFSPLRNQRTDAYGGSPENRRRFPLMVCKAVRERCPDRIISLRISGSERLPGGFTIEDMIGFLELAQEYVDFVEVSVDRFDLSMAGTYQPLGLNADLSEAIKRSGKVHIPIYSVGSILHPEQAEEIIASGKADGVSMSRALIADPYWPEKAFSGKSYDITPCLRCLNCTDSDNADRHLVCSVNPLIGREHRLGFGEDIGTAKFKKRVLVIGGGPGGMEAAITAAQRGHDVTLCEKTGELGGLLKFTDNDSLKHDLRRYKNFMADKLRRSGVNILLNTEADAELVKALKVTDVILASGSTPIFPSFLKGAEKAHHASEIYYDTALAEKAKKVIIIGGGLVGVEAGLHLRNLGKEVLVLEKEDRFIRDARGMYMFGLYSAIKERELEILTEASCLEITENGVIYEKDGETVTAEADLVLYAVGMKKNDELYDSLCELDIKLAIAGDCKKIGKVAGAVHDGYFAALDVGRI